MCGCSWLNPTDQPPVYYSDFTNLELQEKIKGETVFGIKES